MRATKFEFEQRFFVFGVLIFVGFGLYQVDHTNAAVGLLHFLVPAVNPDSDQGNHLLRLIFAAGALLVFLAAAFRTWATAYLKTVIVHDMSQHSGSVVADGPYRYVRNPLYLANLPYAAGLGLMASRSGWFFMVLSMWLFCYRLILREEAGLLRDQGQQYKDYLDKVPRFWPAFSPRVQPGGGQAAWAQAFAGESLFWLIGVAILCFAVTLDLKKAALIFLLSFAVYFACVFTLKHRLSAVKN